MKLIKKNYWPIMEKILLTKEVLEIKTLSALLKKDANFDNVTSAYNIFYKKPKNELNTLDIHTPTNFKAPLPCVFYVHGGAWMTTDKSIYTPFCKKLASLGFVVVNINYKLMPEVEIEDCIKDVSCAIDFIVDSASTYNIDPLKLFAAGDSAGAHLVSYNVATRTKSNQTKCKFLATALFYGVFDFTTIHKSKFPIIKTLHNRFTKAFKKQYPKNWDEKQTAYYKSLSVNPLLTANFPPVFITSGRIDKLNPQTMAFIKNLEELNVDYSPLIFPKSRVDGLHAFLNISFFSSSKQAFSQMVHFFYSFLSN